MNVIPEQIIFVSRGIIVVDSGSVIHLSLMKLIPLKQ